MHSERFDTLAKILPQPGTRRSLVRLLAALPLRAPLTVLGGHAPDATADDDDHGSSHRCQRLGYPTTVRDETRADACVMQGVA